MSTASRETNKNIRKMRIMKVFIEVAETIMHEEGLGAISTRKVSERAGYNSTSMYHYFDDLDHLVFLVCLGALDEYNATPPKVLVDCRNAFERYLKINQKFFESAYCLPEAFRRLLYVDSHDKKTDYTKQYFELFPEREVARLSELQQIAHTSNLFERHKILINLCTDAGYMEEEKADEFNEVTLMIYKCILDDRVEKKISWEEAVEKSMYLYWRMLCFYAKEECLPLLMSISLKEFLKQDEEE